MLGTLLFDISQLFFFAFAASVRGKETGFGEWVFVGDGKVQHRELYGANDGTAGRGCVLY